MATLEQKLRKALRGYLERLGNMSLADRVKYADAFEDVYNIVLNSPGRLELRHADVAAVRVFLWNYQYRRCAITGKPLRLASAVLDHCHRTGRVRAVVH
ncbi:endonuclease VII domain-containing protein, partial [Escherichia coli]|uniref:endonuclease VII domain-containing protein n=2 Tax=Enterobacterales TaxID=91347 RepID=UPI001BE4DEF9